MLFCRVAVASCKYWQLHQLDETLNRRLNQYITDQQQQFTLFKYSVAQNTITAQIPIGITTILHTAKQNQTRIQIQINIQIEIEEKC